MPMKKSLLALLALFFGVFLALQLVPVERSNPAVTAPLEAPAEVEAVLRRSCFDCHSNETRWPWYAYVAPVSWLVADDVHEAREEMNFSRWGELPAEERAELREEIREEVAEGEMPLPKYLYMHPEARLSAEEKALLRSWSLNRPLRGKPGGG